MKRIVLATPLFPPEIGGPATYAAALAGHFPNGEIILVKFGDVRRLPKVVRHLAYFWRAYRAARRADVVLALDPVSVGFPAMLAATLARKKFLLRIAGDYAWEQGRQRWGVTAELDEFVHAKQRSLFVRVFQWLQAFVARRADRIIVPSEYFKNIIAAWDASLGRKIEVIYSSIELPVVAQEPHDRPQGFLICTIARLVPWKGIDGIIRVLAEQPDWKLVVVGDGPERSNLEVLARQAGVADRVSFMGQLPRAQALGWAKVSDVFVLNSTYEGLSHVLVEVLSLGVPVVATHVGGNAEVVQNDATGLLIEAGNDEALLNAVESLEHSSQLKKKFAEAAPIFVQQHFSIAISVARLHDVLQKL